MPELPEVETVCRQLRAGLLGPGRRVLHVDVQRVDVVRWQDAVDGTTPRGKTTHAALLAGDRVIEVLRHGKQLAVVGRSGRVVVVHLGMSGQLRLVHNASEVRPPKHTHVRWRLSGGDQLWFTDPRRFGGLWCYPTRQELFERRWSPLGVDAVEPTLLDPESVEAFWRRLKRSKRAIKAALLDQSLIAGVGNIYADEALFRAGLRPTRRTDRVTRRQTQDLLQALQTTLHAAIQAGGSTLRDYRQASGQTGGYQKAHQVYGQGGCACPRCSCVLKQIQVAQRTTVFCPACQA